ncbi:hypothetical protein [Flavobacterium sp.]|uniref:hypothetical protein n=1 Tax=Flavobacterium sp. TaxID=239 RepID=UPI002BA6CDC4|nr:hypothetical protein [Flavobacterium sp.]HSD06942.1 hypothetical protein [Flavobacterium sp.]
MMTSQKKGIGLILLGITMLVFSTNVFACTGGNSNATIDNLGLLSFIFWLPTLTFGVILSCIEKQN